MDIASTISFGDNQNEKCDYCGAEFKTEIINQTGHNEKEEYDCPECQKEFYSRVSMPIRVKLIKPRTDGKTDTYKN